MMKKILCKSIIILYFLIDGTALVGQTKTLTIRTNNSSDSSKAFATAQLATLRLRQKGYLASSVDSVGYSSNHYKFHIFVGKKINTVVFNPITKNRKTHKRKAEQKLNSTIKKILKELNNTGYPMATVGYDSLLQISDTLLIAIRYNLGPLFYFDSAVVRGQLKIKPKIVNALTEVKTGDIYNARKVKLATMAMANTPSVKLMGQPIEEFERERCKVVFFAEKRKSSTFDAIVGLTPNPINENQLLFTGNVNLVLDNLFARLHKAEFNWVSVKPATQTLYASYYAPYIMGSPVGFGGSFFLNREDSTFFSTQTKWTVTHTGLKSGTIRLEYDQQNTDPLSESAFERWAGPQQTYARSSFNGVGLGWMLSHLDNPFYPHNGTKISLGWLSGNKVINSLQKYDSLPTKTIAQHQFKVGAEYYTKLGASNYVLRLATKSEGRIANQFLINEAFRVGGIAQLRGFAPNFFFANRYATATIESQFYFEPEAFINFFIDQAIINDAFNAESNFWATGIGAGLQFSTKAGIFSFVYAMGRAPSQQFGLRGSVIQFGLTGRF